MEPEIYGIPIYTACETFKFLSTMHRIRSVCEQLRGLSNSMRFQRALVLCGAAQSLLLGFGVGGSSLIICRDQIY